MTIPSHSLDTPVGQLEWVTALRRKFRFRADKSAIEFWRPSITITINEVTQDWIKHHPTIDEVARFCQPALSINKALEESWDPDHVHFLITAEELAEGSDPMTLEASDLVSELPLQVMHRRFREGRVSLPIPPSTAATSREYAKLQKNSKTAIYDGFYAHKQGQHPTIVTVAPPVQIFHPVFQEFLDRINGPAFEPNEEMISIVSELMPMTTEIHTLEDNALTKLRPLLTGLLGGYLGQVISTGSRTPDGMVSKQLGDCIAPLVCTEYKRAFGEGGCDPSTQASYSIRGFLVLAEFKRILEKCCCPSFILAGGGPYLSILGVVYTDKFVVQRLTDVKWIGEATTHEDARVYHLARVFASLRLAVAVLDKYYDEVSQDPDIPALVFNEPHPRFFPYPTKYEEYRAEANIEPKCTEFEYINAFRADPSNVTFLAKVKSSDQKLVIKFVDRYGVEAHQLLADAGMAPRLLYCGLLDGKNDVRNTGSPAQDSTKLGGLYVGPMRMVVMEHIEGKTAEEESTWPNDAREKIETAIQKLHNSQLVFGDLRGPNVVFSGGNVFLIDFDWAGRVNEARYPRNLSRRVKWPRKAEELEMKPILVDHDLFMLDQLFPK